VGGKEKSEGLLTQFEDQSGVWESPRFTEFKSKVKLQLGNRKTTPNLKNDHKGDKKARH